MFDSRQLEYIIAIAEEESLSKAADRLFISQSALSQQLSKLYQQGIPQLFYYENKKMKLTTAGKIYINGARAMLNAKARTEQQIEEIKSDNNQTSAVRLFASSCFNEILYKSVLPGFHKRFPTAEISLANNECLDNLMNDAAEYDFLLLPQSMTIPDYQSLAIPHQSLGLVYSHFASMPLPVFLPHPDDPMYPVILSALSYWKLSLPVYAHGNDSQLILNNVSRGLCCCTLDYRYLTSYPELKLYTKKKPFIYSLYVYYRETSANKTVCHFMNELLMKSLMPSKGALPS